LLFAKALLSREQGDYLFRLVESKLAWLEQSGVVSHRRQLGGQGEPFRIYYTGDNKPSDALLEPFLLFGPGTVVFVQGDVAAAFGRFDDYPAPYYAGAKIQAPETLGTYCSSGFGGLSSNGSHYLLTAYHCIHPADPRMWTWSNHLIGSAGSHDPKWDVTYIRASTAPYIYSGTSLGDNATTSVVGVAGYQYGAQVCGSGSTTYRVCGATVYSRDTWTLTHPATKENYTVSGYLVARGDQYFFAKGDSGGPIYTPSGSSGALARGIYSAFPTASQTTCPSHVTTSNCYSQALTPDLAAVANEQQLNFAR
jgi:hypothetical protein